MSFINLFLCIYTIKNTHLNQLHSTEHHYNSNHNQHRKNFKDKIELQNLKNNNIILS
jgi:hypothetical protein